MTRRRYRLSGRQGHGFMPRLSQPREGVIEYLRRMGKKGPMSPRPRLRRLLAALGLFAWGLAAGSALAQEGCYADYKASRRDPFELHYGVAEVRGECTGRAAERELARRLAADGWQLLEVVSTFDASGLEGRRESAGDYFLRY
jgi:hypothetical protein